MSLNTAHLEDRGVLLHSAESILIFSDQVQLEFSGQDGPEFKGSKSGRIYLTTHRMVFNTKNHSDALKSFSFPFVSLHDVELEQPVFGANYIKGKVRAQPGGNFVGEAKFKLHFKSGGAIDFGQAMLKAAQMATSNYVADAPPPYSPPGSAWYAAPPPAYSPACPPGWNPAPAFPHRPEENTVFLTDSPPPYPGIPSYSGGGFVIPSAPQAGASQQNFVLPLNGEQPPPYSATGKKND